MKLSEEYLPVEGAGREEMKTFYSWSLEDARIAQSEWEKNSKKSSGRGPLFRWIAAHELKEFADRFFETKDNAMILKAFFICSMNDLPIPKWCKQPFIDAYRDVWFKATLSWDDVFGRLHKKGTHVNDVREYCRMAIKVEKRVEELHEKEGVPIDGSMFDRVGREMMIGGKSKTAEMYYYQKKWFDRMTKDLEQNSEKYMQE